MSITLESRGVMVHGNGEGRTTNPISTQSVGDGIIGFPDSSFVIPKLKAQRRQAISMNRAWLARFIPAQILQDVKG